MRQAILIRVEAENFDQWRIAHDECCEARSEYGISDGPFYFDEKNSKQVMVHLDIEDMEKASGWFKDPRFKAATERAGNVSRQIWIGTLKQ